MDNKNGGNDDDDDDDNNHGSHNKIPRIYNSNAFKNNYNSRQKH